MLPHEKKLVKLLDGKPFALLGINSDGDAAKVKQILAEQEITWRQAIDESTDGPLASKSGATLPICRWSSSNRKAAARSA